MKMERISEHPVNTIFLERWSPRAYDANPMREHDLLTILEAARWAPSAFNVQPWRFVYAHRGDAHWQRFLSLLDDFNRGWAQHASALVFVLSDTVMPGDGDRVAKVSRTNSFDAGAAWAQLALQTTLLGYQAHAMAGIDFEAARKALSVPKQYKVEIAVAVGTRAERSNLPNELQEREQPSQRLSLDEIAFAGVFNNLSNLLV